MSRLEFKPQFGHYDEPPTSVTMTLPVSYGVVSVSPWNSTEHVKNAQYTVLLMLTPLLFTACKIHASEVKVLGRNHMTLLCCTSALQ